MTVGELKKKLTRYPDDMDVMTKKTEILGNVGEVNSVIPSEYAFFGSGIKCVLLTDEYEGGESG